MTTDFSETDRSLRLLDLDANARLRKWSLERIWRDYRPWILFSIALLVLLVCYSFLVGWLVRRRTAELAASLARERAADSRARAASDRIAKMEKIGLLGQVSGLFAHEIRQPLSVIAIHAWSLRRMAQRGEATSESVDQSAAVIGEQADAADRIVEKVRAVIRSKSAVRKRFDLAEAADRAVASYRASGKLKAEVVFSSRAPAPVYADPLELELVLLNLIRNADEAMEAAGTRFPKIYLTTEESAGSSSVRVEDDGPAVDLEAFERRADAMESTKDGGLGLGLSIARSLTEAQGGAMRFSRGPRGGVAVTLSFPEDRGPEPEGAGKEKET